MSDFSAECTISLIFQKESHGRTGFFSMCTKNF